MDWITIISIIASALSGGLLTYFINPRAAIDKPKFENDATKAQTNQTNFQTYNDSMTAMQSTILSQENRNKELFELNVKAHDEINDLKSDLVQCSMALCANGLCPLREPEKGLGDEVFKQCKENKTNFLNTIEFEDFAAAKGYVVKRTKNKDN